jgi:DNA-binding transcriptional ArsR family regulator
VDELARTFAALSDPTRCAVIGLLRHEPLCSSAMADALSTSRPMMSRHLRVLREAGLVEEESPNEDARVRVYRLCREPFTNLRSWLDDVEAFWGGQLAAFKAHAERTRGRRRP